LSSLWWITKRFVLEELVRIKDTLKGVVERGDMSFCSDTKQCCFFKRFFGYFQFLLFPGML